MYLFQTLHVQTSASLSLQLQSQSALSRDDDKIFKTHFCKKKHLGPVVRRVDNFIQRINSYPADKIGAFLILIGQRANFIHWIGIYPLDNDIHSTNNRALVFSWANSDSCPGINRAKCFRTGPKRYCCSKGAEPYIHIYAVNKRRGLMQKTRRLMDENSVSFQMSLILLSFITLGSESQISVFKQCQSNTQMSVFSFFFGGGGSMRRSQNLEISFRFIRHFARFNFSRLSLAFIAKYNPTLLVVKR